MTCDYLELAVAGVQGLTPYVPGKPVEELQREKKLDTVIKLASNENPLGPSATVLAAIDGAKQSLARYPDGNGFRLKQALSAHLTLDPGQITLGNGSNDVLDLIARAYLGPGDEAVFSQYAFAVYPLSVKAVGATAIETPALNWGHDLEAMAAAVSHKTKVIFIANPNNPTGTWFGKAQWEAFIRSIPEQVLVVLDEAYFEYAWPQHQINGLGYLSQYPNLILTRTFSKAYGLAALRVGYGLSNRQVADALNRVRQPFNVNSLALEAAVAALTDQNYLRQSQQVNQAGMRQLLTGFESMGLDVIPSAGNFVSVHVPGAAAVNDELLSQGVIVRPLAGYGMPDWLRISIGLPEENQHLLAVLADILPS